MSLVYRANLLCNFKDNINLKLRRWDKGLEIFSPIAKKYPFHLLALDCIHSCHQALGNDNEVNITLQRIESAMQHDIRARALAEEYGDLLSPPAQDICRKVIGHNGEILR